MTALRPLLRSYRSYLIVLGTWIACAALVVGGSLLGLRWQPMWLGAVWILFSVGMVLWLLVGLIDPLWRRLRANDAASGGGKIGGGRVFRSAVALWTILTGFYCFGAFIDDGTWFLIAMAGVPVIVFWIAVMVWAIVLTAVRLRHRAYGPALRTALVPLLGTAAFFYGQNIGDVLRFELERPSYLAAVAALRAGGDHDDHVEVHLGPPMVAYFLWGGMIWASYGVVFDETDQVAKPTAARRAAWGDRDVPTELKCEGDALPVGGHFYVGRFAC